MKCGRCKYEVNENDIYCPECGAKLIWDEVAVEEKAEEETIKIPVVFLIKLFSCLFSVLYAFQIFFYVWSVFISLVGIPKSFIYSLTMAFAFLICLLGTIPIFVSIIQFGFNIDGSGEKKMHLFCAAVSGGIKIAGEFISAIFKIVAVIIRNGFFNVSFITSASAQSLYAILIIAVLFILFYIENDQELSAADMIESFKKVPEFIKSRKTREESK